MCLLRSRPLQLLHCAADIGPLDNETVVGQRLIRPLLALTYRVEPVGQVTSHLAVSPDVLEDSRCARITVRLQCPDQPLRNLPGRETLRRDWIPVAGELIPAQQAHLATLSP